MKRFFLIIAAIAIMGTSYAQLSQVGKTVGKGIVYGFTRGLENGNQAVKNAENNAKRHPKKQIEQIGLKDTNVSMYDIVKQIKENYNG